MSNIDWKSIEKWEGVTNTMYVPTDSDGDVLGHSGPTIGTGVDLGGWNSQQLKDIGVMDALIEKLKPYLGRKGDDAAKYVKEHPLTLSDSDRIALDRAVQGLFVSKLTDKYNNAIDDDKKTFTQLPQAMQTVLYSVTHQYGLGIDKKCPKFWKLAIEQKWKDLVDELRNFGDNYGTRRNEEADLIQSELDGE